MVFVHVWGYGWGGDGLQQAKDQRDYQRRERLHVHPAAATGLKITPKKQKEKKKRIKKQEEGVQPLRAQAGPLPRRLLLLLVLVLLVFVVRVVHQAHQSRLDNRRGREGDRFDR